LKSDREYLDHISEEIHFIVEKSKYLTKENFINDDILKRAFVRSIEIIGEAVKNLSVEYKNSYPDIEWRKIAGIRDRLIHGYFSIDYDIIWDVVSNKIPELKEKIKNDG
jgi:uncharacterized protein with HEPN domain